MIYSFISHPLDCILPLSSKLLKILLDSFYGQYPGGKCQVWYYEGEFCLIFQGYIEGYIDFK